MTCAVLDSFLRIVRIVLRHRPSKEADRPLAPYLEANDLVYDEFTEQNHLMQPSPYRGKPTPQIEEAWIGLWRCQSPFR